MGVVSVPVARWREVARRLYENAGLPWLLWRTEVAAYSALLMESDAEDCSDILELAGGMACGLQEYVEERERREDDTFDMHWSCLKKGE